MAEGICYLIEHPKEAERMGENARKIAEIANGQAVYEEWCDYIEEVCGRKRAGALSKGKA